MSYSAKTKRILKTMYKTGSINKNELPHPELHRLFQDRYISNSSDYHDTNVYITDEGRAYVEEINRDLKRYKEEIRRSWIQFWIPVVISLVALFRPEITSLIKCLATLLVDK